MATTVRNGCKMSVLVMSAFVFMTTVFGGGWATGANSNVYFISQGGYLGLITPIVGMFLVSFVGWLTLEFARMSNVWNYGDFMHALYGTPVIKFIFDVIQIVCLPITAGALFATFAGTLSSSVGGNYYMWLAVFFVITLFSVMWGTKVVSRLAGFMGTIILILLITIFATVIANGSGNFSHIMAERTVYGSVGGAWWWGAVKFWMLSAGMCLSLLPAYEPMQTRRDTILTCTISYLFCLSFILIINFLVLAYSPESIQQTVPILYAIQQMDQKWLQAIYVIVVCLAVITTGNGLTFGYTVRFMNFAAVKKWKARDSIKMCLLSAAQLIISLVVSLAGLTAIISKGYSYMSYLNSPLVAYGIPLFVTFKLIAAARKGKGAERGCLSGMSWGDWLGKS